MREMLDEGRTKFSDVRAKPRGTISTPSFFSKEFSLFF